MEVTDIVERLRDYGDRLGKPELLDEAADEIERLRPLASVMLKLLAGISIDGLAGYVSFSKDDLDVEAAARLTPDEYAAINQATASP